MSSPPLAARLPYGSENTGGGGEPKQAPKAGQGPTPFLGMTGRPSSGVLAPGDTVPARTAPGVPGSWCWGLGWALALSGQASWDPELLPSRPDSDVG